MFDAGMIAVLAPFLMVVGIVWVRSNAQIEEKRIAAAAERDQASGSAADRAQIEELEDRVAILERIVTDKGYDVAAQIEALRDERRVEHLLERREGERSN